MIKLLFAFLGASISGPISITRLRDQKVFYLRDDGAYESDDDYERLPSYLVEDVIWEDAFGYHADYAKDTPSLGGYADGGHASG